MERYMAKGLSRTDIRLLVKTIRAITGMETIKSIPIIRFLELVLPKLVPGFQLEIVPVNEMGAKHGETFPSRKLIRIREDIYFGALNGNGRDRLTIAHEIAHLFLHKSDNVALCRIASGEKLPAYEDPEWQANAFAGELLAPSYLIDGKNVSEVSREFGVSYSAAQVQLDTLIRHPLRH